MDLDVGDIADCDVLVEDGKIAAIGRGLQVADALEVDAEGTIVLPGFIDTHRHTWQTAIRGVLGSCTLDGYLGAVLVRMGPEFRPEDVYIGNLLGSLEALSAGITTLYDWSHATNTPEHADAKIMGLREAGIRAVFGHGWPSGSEWVDQSLGLTHPEDIRRLAAQYFNSADQLLTLALAARGPDICTDDVLSREWALARELGVRITVHLGHRVTGRRPDGVSRLHRLGLMGPDTTYVHCTELISDDFRRVADTGGSVSVAPYVELLMGHGAPPIDRCIAHGIRPTLSVDVVTSAPGDMFTQMRTALAYTRSRSLDVDVSIPFAPTLGHRDVLSFATIDGAAAAGLAGKTGSLSIGKDADIILIRGDDINTMPVIDPVATVVTSADTSNVDTVLVAGRIVKRHGKLIDVDLPRVRTLANASRNHVLDAAGFS